MTESFSELWLDGKPAKKEEYWQQDIKEFNLAEVRAYDNGRGIITGHPVEPLYGRTYLPKKFKIAFTVPGDNSVDLYINDIGCVVIMEADGETLKGFNIVVGGGMGRTHRKEETFARAADHLGFVHKDDFFEAMKAILATQRDHGNREVRSSARLKYLVHTLGIDDFRALVEKYYGKAIEPWPAPRVEVPRLDGLARAGRRQADARHQRRAGPRPRHADRRAQDGAAAAGGHVQPADDAHALAVDCAARHPARAQERRRDAAQAARRADDRRGRP